MMDDNSRPEVTLEPADNGWVVRHHQRSAKRDEPGRTIRRVASTDEEALGHAKTAMGGGKTSKKKSSNRDGQTTVDTGEGASSPVAHSFGGHRSSSRKYRSRSAGRR
jgi:hypothetical protein